MTDTTDQQAVTVAQEDRDAAALLVPLCFGASKQWQENVRAGFYDDGEIVQAFARHRLASVSSASAEPVAWCSPGQLANLMDVDVDGGVYLPIRKTERGNFTMPLYAASPEPVPATNQAGEVDVEALVKKALSIATLGTPGQIAVQIATNAVRTTIAALATQPATSQEGEGLSDRRRLNTILAKHFGSHIPDLAERVRVGNAACTEILATFLAATPTPPTLSEDLREAQFEWPSEEVFNAQTETERLTTLAAYYAWRNPA